MTTHAIAKRGRPPKDPERYGEWVVSVAAKRKRGRPPLGDAKREPVQVYVSADERAEIEAYAEREGETLAGAIREAALRAARWKP